VHKFIQKHTAAARSITALVLCAALLFAALPAFAAAGTGGVKTGNTTVIYGIVASLALLLLLAYCIVVRRKSFWMLLLYVAVFVVNLGYFALALARTLPCALWANRIAYLGSVFLPLCMVMIIAQVCEVKLGRVTAGILAGVGALVFLLAASGPHLGLYYKEVSLHFADGMATLVKVYGPLHIVYLLYLAFFFSFMVGIIVFAVAKKRIVHYEHAAILAALVLGNIAIWFIEQRISWNFEFLSVSYLITEVLLLLLHDVLSDYTRRVQETETLREGVLPSQIEELFNNFAMRVQLLTPAEHMLLQYYIDGCTLSEAADRACISINTAKKHNTNLNRKLGIGSREELQLYIELFNRSDRLEEIACKK